MNTNKYGLKRTIPAAVKRQVRQRCGFGCVNCGSAVYQYEHLEPTFSNAKEHNPNNIVLLCGGCHDRVTRKLLSKETVKIRSQNPICKTKGFSFGPFDIGLNVPKVTIGTLVCTNVDSLIEIHGESIFSVKPPEVDGGPYRINAYLADNEGNEILRIVENEWITSTSNWDVEVIGSRITIRKKIGDISLIIRTEPPHNLIIERLEMLHRGIKVEGRENKDLTFYTNNGMTLKSTGMNLEGCRVGVQFLNDSLIVGVGGGTVQIEQMEYFQSPVKRYFLTSDDTITFSEKALSYIERIGNVG